MDNTIINSTPQPKKKRGRKPKNNITINDNPIFDNNNENDNLVVNLNINDKDNYEIDAYNDTQDNINKEKAETLENKNNNSQICWNCNEKLNNSIPLPLKYVNNIFITHGDFCSPECGCRYALDNYDNEFYEIYSLIHLFISTDKKIKPAKNKFNLIKYGGNLTIEKYKEENIDINKLIIKPYIQTYINYNNINNIENLNNLNNLKLYRKKNKKIQNNGIFKYMKLNN